MDVNATRGTRARTFCRSNWRICREAPSPSSTGICRSIRIRSSRASAAIATASAPSAASSDCTPKYPSISDASSRLHGLSSATRTRKPTGTASIATGTWSTGKPITDAADVPNRCLRRRNRALPEWPLGGDLSLKLAMKRPPLERQQVDARAGSKILLCGRQLRLAAKPTFESDWRQAQALARRRRPCQVPADPATVQDAPQWLRRRSSSKVDRSFTQQATTGSFGSLWRDLYSDAEATSAAPNSPPRSGRSHMHRGPRRWPRSSGHTQLPIRRQLLTVRHRTAEVSALGPPCRWAGAHSGGGLAILDRRARARAMRPWPITIHRLLADGRGEANGARAA